MIARWWRGWTSQANADAYQRLMLEKILPAIDVEGYRGVQFFRRDVEEGVEFAALSLWDSADSLRTFAGQDYEKAVIPPDAEPLLKHYDVFAAHYEIVSEPGASRSE